MFDGIVKQGMQALTGDEFASRVAADAQQRGPAQAIVEAVNAAIGGVAQAAQQAGVEIPPDILEAAQVAIVQVMVAMMKDAGMVEDPGATMKEVAALIKGEG